MSVLDWFKDRLSGGSRGVIHNEDDDNVVSHLTPKAARDYVCETCNADMLKGQQYARLTRRIDGHLQTEKYCLTCRPPSAARVL